MCHCEEHCATKQSPEGRPVILLIPDQDSSIKNRGVLTFGRVIDLVYIQRLRSRQGHSIMKISSIANTISIKAGLLLFILAYVHGQAGQCPDKSYLKYLQFPSDGVDFCMFLVCAEIDTLTFAKADTLKSNKKGTALKDSMKVIFSLWKIKLKNIAMIRGDGKIENIVYYKAKALNFNKPILPYLHKKQVYCLTPPLNYLNDVADTIHSKTIVAIDTLFLWWGYDPRLFNRGIFQRNSYIDKDRNSGMNAKIDGILHTMNFDSSAVDKKRQELNRLKDSVIQYRHTDSLSQHKNPR
jgi:hypothetical protein